MAEGASFVIHAEHSKFNDVNFIFNYKSGTDQTIVEFSSNLTMTNVHTYGSASMTGNVGLFCLYLGQGEISNTYATFTNCVNHANITGTSYNSLFVGYTFVGLNTVLNFDGCKMMVICLNRRCFLSCKLCWTRISKINKCNNEYKKFWKYRNRYI